MPYSNIKTTIGLSGTGIPATPQVNTAQAPLGTTAVYQETVGVDARLYTARLVADTNGDVGTLALSTGVITGNAVGSNSGVNFQGVALAANTNVRSVRIKTSGAGTVTVAFADAAGPDAVYQTGTDMVIRFGTVITGDVVFTFSLATGQVDIDVFAE